MAELMDMLKTASVAVPVWQLSLVLIAIAVCLVFRLNGTGLILAFIFTFHLGWIFCRTDLAAKSSEYETYGVLYLVCGGLVLLLTVINAILMPEESK